MLSLKREATCGSLAMLLSWVTFAILASTTHAKYKPGKIKTVNTLPAGVTGLAQSDFATGTVRLTTAGEYWLTENIVFNPNPGSRNSPGGWFPLDSQFESNGGSYPDGPYSMGFFSALTIEGPDITLNLNGYTMEISEEFQLQQPFGSLIQLASTAFIPHIFDGKEGPGDFGDTIVGASNCVIKNGHLARSIHHAIQGNNIAGCRVEDIEISNYRVAAIHMNNFTDVTIKNVWVKGSTRVLPGLGRYDNGRRLLVFLRRFSAAELAANSVTFHDGRTYTLQQILDRLEYGLDLVFRNAIEGDNSVFSDPAYTGEFFNEDGLPDGGSLYGMVFNGFGLALFGLGDAAPTSSGLTIEDVTVENIEVNTREVVLVTDAENGCPAAGATGNVLPVVEKFSSNGFEDITTATYTGTLLGDAQIALNLFAPASTQPLPSDRRRMLSVPQKISDWALKGTPLTATDFDLHCNGDSQGHVNKGVFAIRIDGTTDFLVKDAEVKNITNSGVLGTLLCGEYSIGEGAHPRQVFKGYTALTVRGISAVNSSGIIRGSDVSDLQSSNGIVIGIDTTYSEVQFKGKNTISDLVAERQTFPPDQTGEFPNPTPSACGVYYEEPSKVKGSKPKVSCVSGLYTCGQSAANGKVTLFGKNDGCSNPYKFHGASRDEEDEKKIIVG